MSICVLLRDKRHRISPWRHVLITAPYQNNIIILATPRLSCYPALTFRDFVSCMSAKAVESRKRSDKWKSRLLSSRGTDHAFHWDENHFREIILKSSAADECYAATITHPVRAISYTATINIVILQSFADIHLCAIINNIIEEL